MTTGTVHHGDCLEVMRGWPDASVGLVVTSPPYNLRLTVGHGWASGQAGRWRTAPIRHGYEDHDDRMPHDAYVAWQREVLTELMRLLRPDGAIFYNHKWRVQNGLIQDRADIMAGFPVRQILVWERTGGINFDDRFFLPNYEVVYLVAQPAFRLVPGGNAAGCVWRIPQEQKNPHPAPFPVALPARCIKASQFEGPVLDPFVGSGTTAIAAEQLDRDWIGIEKSAEYVAMARQRIERFRRQPRLWSRTAGVR